MWNAVFTYRRMKGNLFQNYKFIRIYFTNLFLDVHLEMEYYST